MCLRRGGTWIVICHKFRKQRIKSARTSATHSDSDGEDSDALWRCSLRFLGRFFFGLCAPPSLVVDVLVESSSDESRFFFFRLLFFPAFRLSLCFDECFRLPLSLFRFFFVFFVFFSFLQLFKLLLLSTRPCSRRYLPRQSVSEAKWATCSLIRHLERHVLCRTGTQNVVELLPRGLPSARTEQ